MKLGLWMLGALLVFVIAACSDDPTGSSPTRDDTFVVGRSPTVVVSVDNGRIIVNRGTDGRVRVQATLRKPGQLEYATTQAGNLISVEAKDKGGGIFDFGASPGADIEITAPSDTMVELRSVNGSVEVYGMQQSGTIRTSNGTIVVQDVSGDFDISTLNGVVTIALASGTFAVETLNGRIDFDGTLTPGAANRLTTANGSVAIKLQGTPSVELDASTANGSVATELPILMTSTGAEHRLVGTIGDGDAELYVRTSNGSITIQ